MALEINTLGRFQLIIDDRDLTTQLDASRAFLLTYLADTGQPQPRVHLAELLWPERPHGRARSNLRTLLSRLRPLLPDYLQMSSEWVALRPSSLIQLDVHAFEAQIATAQRAAPLAARQALASAMTYYQGYFLASSAGDWNTEIESWLMTRRLALHSLAVQALRQLLMETNDQPLAMSISYAHALLKLEPLDETVCSQLMVFLAQNGQRNEALWYYQRYQRALTEVWTTAEPSEKLVTLAAKIRLGLQIAPGSPAQKAVQDRVPTALQRIETEPMPAKETSTPLVNGDAPQQGVAADQNQRAISHSSPSRITPSRSRLR